MKLGLARGWYLRPTIGLGLLIVPALTMSYFFVQGGKKTASHQYILDGELLSKERGLFEFPKEKFEIDKCPIWKSNLLSWNHVIFFPAGVASERIVLNFQDVSYFSGRLKTKYSSGKVGMLSFMRMKGRQSYKVWHTEIIPAKELAQPPRGTLRHWLQLNGMTISSNNKEVIAIVDAVQPFAMYEAAYKAPSSEFAFVSSDGYEKKDKAHTMSVGFSQKLPYPLTSFEIDFLHSMRNR